MAAGAGVGGHEGVVGGGGGGGGHRAGGRRREEEEEEGEAVREARAERKEESLGSWEHRRGSVGRKGIGGGGRRRRGCGERRCLAGRGGF